MGALDCQCRLGWLASVTRARRFSTFPHTGFLCFNFTLPRSKNAGGLGRHRRLQLLLVLLLNASAILVAQDSIASKRFSVHSFRLALSGQGSFSKNWQGALQEQSIWLLDAQIEPNLLWRFGRWSFHIPILLEGQATWIPDSLYSVVNDRLIVGCRFGWRVAGQDSLPHSLHLEYGQRLETRWLPKPWLQKLRSFSKGAFLESDHETEPYLLNPGLVFLSFGLTCRLWNNLRLHAGLAGAKLNFVLNRYSGSDTSSHIVWGIEPSGSNPHLQWGWNAEFHWEKKGRHGIVYLLQAILFSPPQQPETWSGRGKAELNFPVKKGFSMGWQAQWSYEPAQFDGHQWQQSIFLRLGAEHSP